MHIRLFLIHAKGGLKINVKNIEALQMSLGIVNIVCLMLSQHSIRNSQDGNNMLKCCLWSSVNFVVDKCLEDSSKGNIADILSHED